MRSDQVAVAGGLLGGAPRLGGGGGGAGLDVVVPVPAVARGHLREALLTLAAWPARVAAHAEAAAFVVGGAARVAVDALPDEEQHAGRLVEGSSSSALWSRHMRQVGALLLL